MLSSEFRSASSRPLPVSCTWVTIAGHSNPHPDYAFYVSYVLFTTARGVIREPFAAVGRVTHGWLLEVLDVVAHYLAEFHGESYMPSTTFTMVLLLLLQMLKQLVVANCDDCDAYTRR